MSERLGFIVFLGALATVAAAYNDVFYTTGTTYYEACYRKTVALTERPPRSVAADPYEQIIWENCDKIAERGIYSRGLIFEAGELGGLCPSNWDAPIGGAHYWALKLIQEDGGLHPFDSVLPAEMTVGRVFADKWPQCASTRESRGYPKIVERLDGTFDWETPCTVC